MKHQTTRFTLVKNYRVNDIRSCCLEQWFPVDSDQRKAKS